MSEGDPRHFYVAVETQGALFERLLDDVEEHKDSAIEGHASGRNFDEIPLVLERSMSFTFRSREKAASPA